MSPPSHRAGLTPAPFFLRILEAIFLRRDVYQRVAADADAWRPATGIVLASSLMYSAVMPDTPYLHAIVEAIHQWVIPLVMLFGVIRWLISTAIMYALSLLLARKQTDLRKLLRCLGFAQAPAMLGGLGLVVDVSIAQFLPPLIGVWLLVAAVVAVRYALDVSFGRAALIGGLGYALDFILPRLIGLLVFVIGG
jgi:hypothetical protein